MIFVDTSALVCRARPRRPESLAREEHVELVTASRRRLILTDYVLVETTALVQHRLGMEAVRALCGDMLPALDMHWIGEDEHSHAQNALLAADRRKVSLVDCSSLHVMRSRMMLTAFTFDPHFREQGFEVLPTPVTGDDERASTHDSD